MGSDTRRVLRVAGLILLVLTFSAAAQPAKVHRIGYLTIGVGGEGGSPPPLFDELRRLGHAEGRNLVVERRNAKGDLQRLETSAKELVALKVDLIIAAATPAVKAAQRSTSSIPIVFAVVVDPVGAGLVASLRRPGANVTGVSLLSAELGGKRLELLQELVPNLTRVAVLTNPANESNALQLRELQSVAKTRGLQLQAFEVKTAAQTGRALEAVGQSRAGALIALDDQVIAGQRASIVAAAQAHRLPTVGGIGALADAGFLVVYGPNLSDHFRRVAAYAAKILKGAKPADLPVEQPSEFELIINMKTARALGATVPRSLLLRADRVIE